MTSQPALQTRPRMTRRHRSELSHWYGRRSSGTPIAVKPEPEEISATPPKRTSVRSRWYGHVCAGVSEPMDGSNFHGNRMHQPILPSSSTGLSYPFRAVTQSTVDISGERRQTRRMPSPEEVTLTNRNRRIYLVVQNSQLFPIEEGSSVTFETDSPFSRGPTPRHMQKTPKSLESDSPALSSFDRWLGPSSLDASPRSYAQSPTESGRECPISHSRSRYRHTSSSLTVDFRS